MQAQTIQKVSVSTSRADNKPVALDYEGTNRGVVESLDGFKKEALTSNASTNVSGETIWTSSVADANPFEPTSAGFQALLQWLGQTAGEGTLPLEALLPGIAEAELAELENAMAAEKALANGESKDLLGDEASQQSLTAFYDAERWNNLQRGAMLMSLRKSRPTGQTLREARHVGARLVQGATAAEALSQPVPQLLSLGQQDPAAMVQAVLFESYMLAGRRSQTPARPAQRNQQPA